MESDRFARVRAIANSRSLEQKVDRNIENVIKNAGTKKKDSFENVDKMSSSAMYERCELIALQREIDWLKYDIVTLFSMMQDTKLEIHNMDRKEIEKEYVLFKIEQKKWLEKQK